MKWGQGETSAHALQQLMNVVGESLGRTDEALALSQASLGMAENVDRKSLIAGHHNVVGLLHLERGALDEARTHLKLAVDLWTEALGRRHPDTLAGLNNLGLAYMRLEQYDEAEQHYNEALEVGVEVWGAEHPTVAGYRNNLAVVFFMDDKVAEAEREFRAALEIREKQLGPEHPVVANARSNLARVLIALERHEQAEAELRTALEILHEVLGGEHRNVEAVRAQLGVFLVERDRAAEAVSLLEQAWAFQQGSESRPNRRAETAFYLAQPLWASDGDRGRALQLASDAQRDYAEAGAPHAAEHERVSAWLKQHRPTQPPEVGSKNTAP